MKFDFEKFKKVTSMSGCGVFVLRSDEEKAAFKKYLDEKQYPYDEAGFEHLSLSNEGLFYVRGGINTILSCDLLDYDKYYMEDFIVEDFSQVKKIL